ncbi:conserved hypothetical protein [Hyella patelloides LEGE 07179]|uniref:Uncharacterized protein n=1 Tax=Hyella patelloides LEGE 07179 TaxID=945734 RepID=A0A563VY08_9CYAN|nr:hypothetical protein [Hyella patelloides]VEP16295.1 conserved hypothetical protein [Hyella patelloides LEGE 07179]
MLADRRKNVYLSFISTDLPLWNIIEGNASLYQKDRHKFHLLLNQYNLPQSSYSKDPTPSLEGEDKTPKGLLWLEVSPSRVILTMQSNGSFSYRHFWERGVYGISRYWLNANTPENSSSFRLRNFTRFLQFDCDPFPTRVQIDYELWSSQLKLGSYVLHLDIDRAI